MAMMITTMTIAASVERVATMTITVMMMTIGIDICMAFLSTGSHCHLSRGLYELNLLPWYAAFDKCDFLILKLDDMKDGDVQHSVEQVWRHLQLPSSSQGPINVEHSIFSAFKNLTIGRKWLNAWK
jgi:hypothetical protein